MFVHWAFFFIDLDHLRHVWGVGMYCTVRASLPVAVFVLGQWKILDPSFRNGNVNCGVGMCLTSRIFDRAGRRTLVHEENSPSVSSL